MLADTSKTMRKSRTILAFVALFAVAFVVSTALTASFSAGEFSGLLLISLVAATGTILIGWVTLTTFAYSASLRGHRSTPLAAASLAAALVGGTVCILALIASILIEHVFAGPIFALQLVWSFALGALGLLALVGTR